MIAAPTAIAVIRVRQHSAKQTRNPLQETAPPIDHAQVLHM
jgi:hypothetical protein